MTDTTFQNWPEQLKQKRGLFNGKRVQMGYESRGIARYRLARKLGMPAKELQRREQDWNFWTEEEKQILLHATAYPIGFFTQDDLPVFDAPIFFSWIDEDGETHCHVEMRGTR
jgi:hypothetical protein